MHTRQARLAKPDARCGVGRPLMVRTARTDETNAAADGLPALRAVVHATPAAAARAGWDDVLALPPFLSTDWLKAFAARDGGGAGGPATRYVQLVDDADRPRFQCLHQVLPVGAMRLGDSVSPRLVSHALGAQAHQVGQALFSGPAFATDLDDAQISSAAAVVIAALELRGACFVKDVPHLSLSTEWTHIDALPEMRLDLPEAWLSLADYEAALPSKYRRRVRRARRKFGGLRVEVLDVEGAARFGESLSRLYARLVERTPYAPYVAPPGYVTRLKALRPEETTLLGYFDGEEMVGFAMLLRDGAEGLAHLAAVAPAYNASHQLYLNVLFDLLGQAIAQGCAVLNYGRTATTIKSSIGAVPTGYPSAVKHTGCVRNGLLRRLTPLVLDPAEANALIQRPLGS